MPMTLRLIPGPRAEQGREGSSGASVSGLGRGRHRRAGERKLQPEWPVSFLQNAVIPCSVGNESTSGYNTIWYFHSHWWQPSPSYQGMQGWLFTFCLFQGRARWHSGWFCASGWLISLGTRVNMELGDTICPWLIELAGITVILCGICFPGPRREVGQRSGGNVS